MFLFLATMRQFELYAIVRGLHNPINLLVVESVFFFFSFDLLPCDVLIVVPFLVHPESSHFS